MMVIMHYLSGIVVLCIVLLGRNSAIEAGPTSEDRILMVAAEQTGIFNTGGLGHTVEGLAKALKRSGKDIEVLMPYYEDLDPATARRVVREEQFFYTILWGFGDRAERYDFDLYSVTDPETGLKTLLLKHTGHPNLFDNRREPGGARRYTNHPNEGLAFALFNKAAAALISRRRYNIINLHDWHTGLVGYYLREYPLVRVLPLHQRRVIFTISNFGYQGLFDFEAFGQGLEPAHTSSERYEFFNKVNFMKAGIQDADHVLTVSQNYLREIFEPRFAGGLEGYLRFEQQRRPFSAITNGANLERWTPTDFSAQDFSGKASGKAQLLRELNLPSAAPLIVMTSRIANQKGFDYLPQALERFFARESQAVVVITGDGEPRYVERLRTLAQLYPNRLVYRPFDAALEHRCTMYGDFFVNTPWYEPSGTNQMFALRAGTIPILSRVGGLPEYITDGHTGYLTDIIYTPQNLIDLDQTAESIARALQRATRTFHEAPEEFQRMRRNAMGLDHSWDQRTSAYGQLFSEIKGAPSLMSRHRFGCFEGMLRKYLQ